MCQNVSIYIKMYQNGPEYVKKFRTFVFKWGCRLHWLYLKVEKQAIFIVINAFIVNQNIEVRRKKSTLDLISK